MAWVRGLSPAVEPLCRRRG